MVSWIMENSYEMAGEPFELYLRTQFDTLSPEGLGDGGVFSGEEEIKGEK